MHVKLGDRVRITDTEYTDHTGQFGTITECQGDLFDGNIEITTDSGETDNYPILNWDQDRAANDETPIWPRYEDFTGMFEFVSRGKE